MDIYETQLHHCVLSVGFMEPYTAVVTLEAPDPRTESYLSPFVTPFRSVEVRLWWDGCLEPKEAKAARFL
jgi:hypothetical protein